MAHDYQSSIFKINARKENIELYRKLTGLESVPKDRGYWTLCNYQQLEDTSEIEQVVKAGLISKKQFHGIDRDKKIIKKNRLWHPEANWYYGDWSQVIESKSNFNPGLIYLDTTSFAEYRIATNMVVTTMMLCPSKTVLFANLMLNDPRSSRRFNDNRLIENITKQIPSMELQQWNQTVQNFNYSATGYTEMITYVFHKV